MREEFSRSGSSVSRAVLGIVGGLLAVGGGIVAAVQYGAAQAASRIDGYSTALGLPSDTARVDYIGMWIGVAAAAVGLAMLLGLLMVVAAAPRTGPWHST